MMEERKKRCLLVLLVVSNLFLLAIIYFIGGVKTNFFKRVGQRVGLVEMAPTDRSDYWCIRGWTNTLKKMNVQYDVVFFGNSITGGSNFHEYFPGVTICNLGYPGDNLDGMMLRIDQIKALNPRKVFVMAGINGLKYQTDKVFGEKYEKLISTICDSVPSAKIYVQSILPVDNDIAQNFVCNNDKIIRSNAIIKEIAVKYKCIYIDLHSLYTKDGKMNPELTRDGVHLFPASYDRWAALIESFVLE